jgi:DNA-binding MarR family transcriptional regulator
MTVRRSTVDTLDLTSRLRLSVTRLARQLRQQSEIGLTPTQQAALASICREGPLTLGALADVEKVAPPTITKVVDKLTELGLVERRPDPLDRRITRVAPTSAGVELLAEHHARKDAWLAQQLAELDGADLARLDDAVAVIESIVSRSEP